MDLRQLHYFTCVAEYLNISHAAQELIISQSTLSRSIRALEEELGVSLFDRQNNVIALTSAGKLFLRRAQELLSIADSARSELLELTSPEKTPIRLMCRCIRQIMYTSVSEFKRLHASACFTILQNDDLALRSHNYDLLISGEPAQDADSHSHKLLTENFLCAVPLDSELAAQPSLTLEQFARQPQIMFGGHRQVQATIQSRLHDLGLQLNPVMLCDDSGTACHFVREGYGVFLVPEFTLIRPLTEYVRLLPVEGVTLTREVYLSWSTNRYLPAYADLYRKFLIRYTEQYR